MEHTSLHAFCKDHNLAKSTVHRLCQELAIITTDGLSPEDQQLLIKELNLTPEPVAAELMEGVEPVQPVTQSLSGGALVPRRGGSLTTASVDFDQDAALMEIEAMRQDAIASVQSVDNLMSRYAQSRIVQAFTEIDQTIETVKSNALNDMGLAMGNAQRRATGNG